MQRRETEHPKQSNTRRKSNLEPGDSAQSTSQDVNKDHQHRQHLHQQQHKHQHQHLHHQQQTDLEANEISTIKATTEATAASVAKSKLSPEADDHKPSTESVSAEKKIIIIALQICNIICWYWTNGMNGIAMQAYAGQVSNGITLVSSSPIEDGTKESNFFVKKSMARLCRTLAITSFVTCIQLLLGALIGRLLLRFVLNPQITWEQICLTKNIPLSSLHAAGSLATNLGFMYGKASLVQVIKLLEPFETLLLSQLLFREGNFTVGIVSSMILVVGAAASLLKLQSTPPLPQAIIFALISGFTLSSRNVLQRKHHHTNPIAKSWTKLEKSVVQFTQLSYYSGLWMAAASAVFGLLFQPPYIAASWQVFLWHPLYNIFSMITLGFCSALTHSLLNAGKRVFAICMAMLWFAEGLNTSTLSALVAVASGGAWYSWEGKRSPTITNTGSKGKFGGELHKLVVSIAGLVLLFAFHGAMAEEMKS